MTQPANYQTAFPQGPITSSGLTVSMEWQRFFLNGWNRSGGAAGVDMTYQVTQIGVALTTARDAAKAAAIAENDAQTAIKAAANAQASAESAQSSADTAEKDAQTGISAAQAAQTTADKAQASANNAENDAQTGIKNAAAAQGTANNALTRANLCVNGQYSVAGSPAQYGLGLVMGSDGKPYFWYNQTNPAQIALVASGSSPTFNAVTLSQLLQLTPVPSSQISGMTNAKPGMVMMSSDNGNLYYRGQDGSWHQIATSGTL